MITVTDTKPRSRREFADDEAAADEMERVLRACHARLDALGVPHGAWYEYEQTEPTA